jgi:hypothetical protein
MTDNKIVGVIGIITLLMGFGGGIILTPSEQSNAYFCEKTNTVGVFYGGISSTNLTAYPYKENRTKSVKCDAGWTKLGEIKTFDETIIAPQIPQITPTRYLCNQYNCTLIP